MRDGRSGAGVSHVASRRHDTREMSNDSAERRGVEGIGDGAKMGGTGSVRYHGGREGSRKGRAAREQEPGTRRDDREREETSFGSEADTVSGVIR